jgi:hypothetical protein
MKNTQNAKVFPSMYIFISIANNYSPFPFVICSTKTITTTTSTTTTTLMYRTENLQWSSNFQSRHRKFARANTQNTQHSKKKKKGKTKQKTNRRKQKNSRHLSIDPSLCVSLCASKGKPENVEFSHL